MVEEEEKERPVSEIIAEYDDEDLIELIELIELIYRQNISIMPIEMIDMQLDIIKYCIFEMNKRSIDSTKLIAVEEKLVKNEKMKYEDRSKNQIFNFSLKNQKKCL